MTKFLLLASLCAACATASAEPVAKPVPIRPVPTRPTPAPPATKCLATGAALFEIKHTTRDGKGPSETQGIYANRAFQDTSTDAEGKPVGTPLIGACISDADLTAAQSQLKDVPWTITTDKITCKALSNQVTIYSTNGKEVFRDVLCSGQHLDPKSAAALSALKAIVEKQTSPAAK